MPRPTNEQGAYLSATMAARALRRAGDPEVRDGLVAALKNWIPDADDLMLREVAERVARDFQTTAGLIEQRRDRLVGRGFEVYPPQ